MSKVITGLWLKLSLQSFLAISCLLTITGCAAKEDPDALGDAAYLDEGEINTLKDFFNGTSGQSAQDSAEVASSNMQTNLLIGILVVLVVLLVVVIFKNKKSK